MKDTQYAEVRCRCPFCGVGKRKVTASLNKDKGLFHCHRCGAGFNSVTLYANVYGMDNKEAYKELLEMA